jgi:hypothetical protein
MEPAIDPKWPTLNVPDWLRPRTDDLARLGELHPDVRFFRAILDAGRIDESVMDSLSKFIASAETHEAAQMATELSRDCLQAVALVAASQDMLSGPHTLYCGKGTLADAFPKPCRTRTEALGTAEAILKSPSCPKDIWLRIEGPNGLSWDTTQIRTVLATRADLT